MRVYTRRLSLSLSLDYYARFTCDLLIQHAQFQRTRSLSVSLVAARGVERERGGERARGREESAVYMVLGMAAAAAVGSRRKIGLITDLKFRACPRPLSLAFASAEI